MLDALALIGLILLSCILAGSPFLIAEREQRHRSRTGQPRKRPRERIR